MGVEKTLILLKPDVFQRSLRDDIVVKLLFHANDLNYEVIHETIVTNPSIGLIKEHYKEHKDKPFFNKLINHMISGDIQVMVFQGENCIENMRKFASNIRIEYNGLGEKNLIHSSDSQQSAEREIALWQSYK